MAVEAARRLAVNGAGAPEAIYFATTTPPYLDKTNAAAIHAALDLGHEGFAVDMAGSARSAVGASRAAATAGGLVVMADLVTGLPGSADERNGAGWGGRVPVRTGGYGRCRDGLERFGHRGVPRPVAAARGGRQPQLGGAVRARDVHAADRGRRRAGARGGGAGADRPRGRVLATRAAPRRRRGSGWARHRAPDGLGYAGAADIGLRFAAVLDGARPGETILNVSAVDGCDAAVLRATDRIADGRRGPSVAEQLEGGREVTYATYLTWRGLLEREPPRRPDPERPAGPPAARAEAWKFAFVGSRCRRAVTCTCRRGACASAAAQSTRWSARRSPTARGRSRRTRSTASRSRHRRR